MYSSTLLALAGCILSLSTAAPTSSTPTSYCPSKDISTSDRLSLFKSFTTDLFSATSNPSAVSSTFAKYVSPQLIEHTASAPSYGAAIGFLTALLPTVSVSVISGLEGCFETDDGCHVCSVHYKASPKGDGSLIKNVTVVSDFYKYEGSCIVEHWDSVTTADAGTTNGGFPG